MSVDGPAPGGKRNTEQKHPRHGPRRSARRGDIGKGRAKGAGNLAKGTGKGALDLVTLHPINAAASLGKGGKGRGRRHRQRHGQDRQGHRQSGQEAILVFDRRNLNEQNDKQSAVPDGCSRVAQAGARQPRQRRYHARLSRRREQTIDILQAVLATEIVCVLRYTMNAIAATGISSEA
jgi:hypothetical protein